MNKSVILSLLFCTLSLSSTSTLSVTTIDEQALCKEISNNLGTSGVVLSPSVHGGDNKVFFIKEGSGVVGIAKCYTKRGIQEVEKICQVSQLLSEHLPIPRVTNFFMLDQNVPVVVQDFLPGHHYECLNEKQLENIALNMAKIHAVEPNVGRSVVSDKEFDYTLLLGHCTSFPEFDFVVNLYHSLDLRYLHELPRALIHGDISASNILFTGDVVSGIIDLDHARFSYRLTDIARAQVFFSFDADGNLDEQRVREFVTAYQKNTPLRPEELNNFYNHLKLLLIKMTVETYYYVEVLQEVSPEIFKKSTFNQSWQLLLKKLQSIKDKTSLVL